MISRYRSALAALALLVLCGAQPASEKANRAQGSEAPHPAQSVAPPPASTPDLAPKFAAYPGYDPDPCYKAEKHDAADLCAQWRAAIAAEKAAHEARRGTNWSIIATLLSVLSLIAVAIALKLTVDSNRIARETSEGQLRPWINFTISKYGVLEVVDGNLEIVAKVSFENIGSSPAIDLTYMATMIFGEEVDPHFRTLIEHFRDGDLDWSDKNLFPKEIWNRNVVAVHTGAYDHIAFITFVVIARYRTPFSNPFIPLTHVRNSAIKMA